jgi:hypothetical protein
MKNRSFTMLALLALASLVVASVALAGSGRDQHRGHRQHGKQHRVDRRQDRRQKRRVFAPGAIVKAAEVSAVELDPLTQQFMQVTFDRGRITAVSSSSITLEQKQDAAVWRTQAFTVPSSAVVTLNGKATTLAQLPTGAAARVESSGSVGGTLAVVRVDAFRFGEAPLPPSS